MKHLKTRDAPLMMEKIVYRMMFTVTSENIIIRAATKTDIPSVDALWAESARYHGELDSRLAMRFEDTQAITEVHKKQLKAKDTLFLVAASQEAVVGYLLARVFTPQPHHKVNRVGLIDGMAVTSAFRQQGIGSRLYEKALRWFETQKTERIDTFVATKNPRAQAFWERKRFTPRIYQISLELAPPKE